ncbi:MAG: esterase-like activity of phytase family protein [Kiritimatiellia bacterium]
MSAKVTTDWTSFSLETLWKVAGSLLLLVSGCRTLDRTTPAPPAPGHTAALSKSITYRRGGELPVAHFPPGLSGVTLGATTNFWAIRDKGGFVYPLTVVLNPKTGAPVSAKADSPKRVQGIDQEGIAYDPLRGTLWIADEEGPKIEEFSLNGQRLGSVTLPEIYRAARYNLSLESLTISPDGLELWTANEEALCNEPMGVDDGNTAMPTAGSLVRLTRFHRKDSQSPWIPSGQWAYLTDSPDGKPYKGNVWSGVSDLCKLDDGRLLVLERAMRVTWLLPSFRCRLYEVDCRAATDISKIRSLRNAPYVPAVKKLVYDADTSFANYEGICRGPSLPDGRKTLLLVSDGDPPAAKCIMTLVEESKTND